MEPLGSLLHSQQQATCPYPETDQSSPCSSFHVLKIHFVIFLPSTPGSSKCALSLRFPHRVCTYPLPHTCYIFHPLHSSWFDHPNNIWWRVQIIKLLIMYSSTRPFYLLGSNVLLSTLFSNNLSPQCASKHVYMFKSHLDNFRVTKVVHIDI